MNRRSFIGGLGTLAAAVAAGAQCHGRPMARRRPWPLGVQLYTLRHELERNFEGTLDRLAAAGYAEVEFAGYFDRSAHAVRSSLRRAGLQAPSGHFPLESLERWDEALEFAATAGHSYVVIPWLALERRAGAQAYRELAHTFNEAAARARRGGIGFAYHNQEYDFTRTNGLLPFDILLEETDPALVEFQLDVYWMVKGGQDPLHYFRTWPGRFPMLHLKDTSGAPDHRMLDVGSGVIDWPAVLGSGSKSGVRHLFVEHDEPASAFASVEASLQYLRALQLSEPQPR